LQWPQLSDITKIRIIKAEIGAVAKKRRRPGRPKGTGTTGTGTLIGVRCHPEFLAAVDKWRAAQPRQPGQAAGLTRPQAIRWLAELGLAANGAGQ
jgi:hypothetical protein